MDNLYAIQRPDGTIIQATILADDVTQPEHAAWEQAMLFDIGLHTCHGSCRTLAGENDCRWIGYAIAIGYRCVEVEVVKAGGRVCEWTEDTEGTFVTSCGNYFQFTADGPKENKFQFCPYCSGKIKEAGK